MTARVFPVGYSDCEQIGFRDPPMTTFPRGVLTKGHFYFKMTRYYYSKASQTRQN